MQPFLSQKQIFHFHLMLVNDELLNYVDYFGIIQPNSNEFNRIQHTKISLTKFQMAESVVANWLLIKQ